MTKGTRIILAMILVIVLPTVIALARYAITKDPTVRPLGITKDALDKHSGTTELEIIAHITGDLSSDPISVQKLSNAVVNAFAAKGTTCRIALHHTPNAVRQIEFEIGPSRLGPYPVSQAARWVGAAVEAYRMNIPFEEEAQQSNAQ